MQFDSFDHYWLAYLRAHSKPATRACHYIGTTLGIPVGLLVSVFIVWWAFLVLGVIGYAIALVSHPLAQHNRPFATKPLWGLICDLRMLGLALTGNLQPHLNRATAGVA